MAKYIFKVYDKITGDLKAQVITSVDSMNDTIKTLRSLNMAKYIFKVYDKITGDLKAQVITSVDSMIDTIKKLNELGMVKGFILDDKENEDDN